MKRLMRVILSLVLTVVLTVVGTVVYVYFNYFVPVSAEYEFSAPITDTTRIEIMIVTRLDGDNLELRTVSEIEDTEAFLDDFSALECSRGISLDVIDEASAMTSFDAIRITYDDGSYEVITAYGNLDSSFLSSDITEDELLEKEYYIFDPSEFGSLIEKYSASK